MRLGIDFGTTRTVVAAVEGGRYPVATFELEGPCASRFVDYLPGVSVQYEGRLFFGGQALELLRRGEGSAVASVKRSITGLAPDAQVDSLTQVSAMALASAYLRWVREMLLNHSNFRIAANEPLHAMIAVPANASTHQRYLSLEAFRVAGFEPIGMVNEPTAAAIEYAKSNARVLSTRSPKRYVIVYDLGGGTFDTAVVRLRDRRFELLASRGISDFGGANFDEKILEFACEKKPCIQPRKAIERVAMLEMCREAKETLRPTSRKVLLDFGDVAPEFGSVILSTAELYRSCYELIERSVSMVEHALDHLKIHGIDTEDPKQLAAVYLVGGASAFPAVARALRSRFKRKLQLAGQPHAATAVGLAIVADPEANIFVREATTRHFGVWREAKDGHAKVFDPLLIKDTSPVGSDTVIATRRYRPRHAVGHLRFLECSDLDAHGQPIGDLMPWAEICFPYDPKLADTVEQLEFGGSRTSRELDQEIIETYSYGQNGTIAVQIENRTHGYARRYELRATNYKLGDDLKTLGV